MGLINEQDEVRVNWFKKFANWKFIVIGIILIIALIFAGMGYYQATRFNSKVSINSISIGGLTTDQAINKLKTAKFKNRVYIGDQLILDGKDTQPVFTNQDLPEVKKLLKKQWTFFPSLKVKNFSLMPKKDDSFRSQTMKKKIKEKLESMNKNLKKPKDAKVTWEKGKVVISKGKNGEQYDIAALLKDYKKQAYTSDIHLEPLFIEPDTKDSPIIKENEKKLQDFMASTVDYNVQDKTYTLEASELIQAASISNDGKVSITKNNMQDKLDEINNKQSTLNKELQFKTHSGKTVTVQAQGYGWAIDTEKEATALKKAFEKEKKSVDASNIYGNGWDYEPIGYETTSNNGIGDTYAEVSISEQRIWIYKKGKMKLTTRVVTGKMSTNEGTSPGIWYILFKDSPHTLKGSAVGNPNYSVDVDYWAPFTNDGQGFHDASWRTNWSDNAYQSQGSAGCVNTPPKVMKAVYDNLNTYDPVVVY
ncbi:L,D-transpeptidase family protein [Lentibacillus sp. N15]|uniref:L,D-transpeptidase family protein n=1 Tax=Lentibacillus songyuanensis TaxID=3136161 RepID=UPI0031BB85EB